MKVHFFATYRPIVGGKEFDIPATPGLTVRGLVDALITRFPGLRPEWLDEHGELYGHVHIFVNGRQTRFLGGLDTPLGEADVVKIFPPIGGG